MLLGAGLRPLPAPEFMCFRAQTFLTFSQSHAGAGNGLEGRNTAQTGFAGATLAFGGLVTPRLRRAAFKRSRAVNNAV